MRVGIVAGEASGDFLAAHLIHALRRHCPELEFTGIAGPLMQAAGVESLFPLERLAVHGYAGVLARLPELLRIRKSITAHFLSDRPHLYIGVDAPDFNLGVAAKLRAAGIQTIQYVAPTIWAWRSNRVHRIRRAVSHVLAVFPFETAVYQQAGIPVTYVGHPMADLFALEPDKAAARRGLGLSEGDVVVALLPGSRRSELLHHAELFMDAAHAVERRLPGVRFIAPCATRETRLRFLAALQDHSHARLPVHVLDGQAGEALVAADGALVASGTATLEAVLAKCPMVITYRVGRLSYRILKQKIRLPYIGLPNIIAGEFIVPELLQEEATAENLAQALVNIMRDDQVRPRVVARFREIHRSIRQNSAERVAQAVLPYLAGAVH
jgi:lipid-A-disaccharide synthase